MTGACHDASPARRRMAGSLAMLAATAFLAAAVPASAQQKPDLTEVSLEDLLKVEVDAVYGASRYRQSISEAPASVTVITHDEITAYGCRTLADVLRSVPGLHVRYDRNYSYLGVRGFSRPGDYNLRVLLLVDGHRANDNIYDQAAVGTEFPIDADLIERIEIIRGPNASLYGTSAFLAVVNVITARGAARPGVSGSLGLASQGTTDASAAFGSRLGGGFEMLLSASAYASDGQSPLYYPEYASAGSTGGYAVNADGDSSRHFFANVGFGDVALRGVVGVRDKHVPTGSFGTAFGDTRTMTHDARGYLDLKYEKTLGVGTFTGRAYYDRYSYRGDYVYGDEATGDTWTNRDVSTGEWWGTEVRLTTAPGRAHRGSVGLEMVEHVRQDQQNFDVDPPATYLDQHTHGRDWAVYGQDQWALTDRLSVNGSLRLDHRGRVDWTLSPRVAAIVDVTPRTTVKGLFGRVFRFPNVYEEYYEDFGVQKQNPELGPETINTWEFMVDRRLPSGFRATAGLFGSRLADLIDQRIDPADGLIMFDNMERATARGLELELEGRPQHRARGVIVRASYTAQWATGDTGADLVDSPRHLLKFNSVLPLDRMRATIGAELQYMSRRATLAGSFVDPFWLANVNLTRANLLLPGLDASVGIFNLFGSQYSDPGGVEHVQDTILQDGRTFRVRIAVRLGAR
jgi:outer membrane receptor for ferrienterochelin and colicins